MFFRFVKHQSIQCEKIGNSTKNSRAILYTIHKTPRFTSIHPGKRRFFTQKFAILFRNQIILRRFHKNKTFSACCFLFGML